MSSFSIIITAGGIGNRMGSDLPKQFMDLLGKPILLHTLELFHTYKPDAQLILTLPNVWKSNWEEILKKHDCSIEHTIVDGGAERYFSIKNALSVCTGEFIAVHDGVRPLVNTETLDLCFNSIELYGQVIPVIPVKESLRQLFDDTSSAVARAEYCIVQTPQCFKRSILEIAYTIPYHSGITDDAGLVENAGYVIHLVAGNEENIKITTPIDLQMAEFLMQIRINDTKIKKD